MAPSAFVQEWEDRVADALEARQGQQGQQAQQATDLHSVQETAADLAGGELAGADLVDAELAGGELAALRAQRAVLSQNPFGFQHIQAPKVSWGAGRQAGVLTSRKGEWQQQQACGPRRGLSAPVWVEGGWQAHRN